MQYFIGIVPPYDYKEKIISFQKQWSNNGLVNVVEPHITIKAQSGLTTDKSWIHDVEKVCGEFSSFYITLAEPKLFDKYVVYLSVVSNELFQLHKMLVEIVKPSKEQIKKYFELEGYTPHLTLGQSYFGMTPDELKEMAKEAENALMPYPTFEVKNLIVYQEIETNKYIPYRNILLKQ